jgi:integrase
MNIARQSKIFIDQLANRKRAPVKPRTLHAYQSYLRSWIIPEVGAVDLSQFENGAMKKFVAKLTTADLAPATVVSIANCVKEIVASAVDANGNQLYPRPWNNDFIDLPIVNQRDQKAPVITRLALETAISGAQGRFKPLYTILAGTGLRISESMALQAGPDDGRGSFWLPEHGKLVIRGQMQNGQFLAPKTPAGFREVDISEDLNRVLQNINASEHSLLFANETRHESGHFMRQAYAAAAKDGIPGFHSLRRFRVTRLREVGTPEDILKFWIGHSSKDISDRYSKLAQNTALRKEWAQRAGLGFDLQQGG